jgi:hypothetical protein
MKSHDGPHDGENPWPDCYGCELKGKNLTLSSAVTSSRTRRQPFRPMVESSWEAGVKGETRPGGGFMPYLDKTLEPIGVKEFGEQRRQLEATRKSQLHNPDHGKVA